MTRLNCHVLRLHCASSRRKSCWRASSLSETSEIAWRVQHGEATDHSFEAGYMRILVAAVLLTMVGPGLAADIAVNDGDTFRLDRTIYRLEGIDAPEID